MIRDLYTGLRMTLVLWIITAIIYPLVIWGLGQALFPYQANGSLLRNSQGEVIGSELIGQAFSADRYFWSRPSTVQYSTGAAKFWLPPGPGENTVNEAIPTGISGASNLAPNNLELLKRV